MNIYLIIILLILIYLNFNEKFGLARNLDLDSEIKNCENNNDCPENYNCIDRECLYKINI